MSFVVDLSDGRQVRRHQDHLRVHHDVGGKGPQCVSHDRVGSSGDSVMVPVAPEPTELSHEGLSEHTNVAPDGLSVQATPHAPVPRPGDTTPELRRSKRQHKPPDRLTC